MQPRRAQRREKFCNARLGHPFSLVSGARSAKEILTALHWITCFLWYLARAARRKFCFCNPSARSAEKNFATLDWVTRFLWYLARAARRKFCFCDPGTRNAGKKNFATLVQVTRFLWYLEMLGQHWVSADGKNTKVERFICRKHNGRAKKSLQKAFFGIFLQKPDPRGYFFSLCKIAHFLIKRCTFSAPGKIFGSETPGQDFRRPPISNYYSTE